MTARERFWNTLDWCVRHWREIAACITAGVLVAVIPKLVTLLTGDHC